MPVADCFFHVIWTTKYRDQLITPEIERRIFARIIRKSMALNSPVHAINGVADHIHVAVSISTSLSVADWVKNVKGVSSHEVNATFNDLPTQFRWQSGYSVRTFAASALPVICEYIARQKEHHREHTLIERLERVDDQPL